MKICVALTLLMLAARPASAQSILRLKSADTASITADELSGSKDQTFFSGHVLVRTAKQMLSADALELDYETLDGKRKLKQAIATGSVLLIDGQMVSACERMVLQDDLVRGTLSTAEVHIKRPGAVLPSDFSALSAGRDSLYLSGNIERLSEKKFRIKDVYFTPCDCGKNRPTFSIHAKEGTVEIGGDAFFYLPVLQPLDVALPFPFALPAMYFPVAKRKSGFLMPMPSLTPIQPDALSPLGGIAFDIEEDYFWAISDSLDATTNIGENAVRGPRLELEFRDAVSVDTAGTIDATLNDDPRYAKDYGNAQFGPGRFAVGAVERVNTNGRYELRLSGNLYSDGNYLRDNTFTLQSQALPYSASRAAFDLRGDELRLQTGVGLMQDFTRFVPDYTRFPTTGGAPNLFNDVQAGVPQRLPDAALSLAPQSLGAGIWIGADARTATEARFMRAQSIYEDGRLRGRDEGRLEFLPRLSRPTEFAGISLVPEVFAMIAEHESSIFGASQPLGIIGGRIDAAIELARYFQAGGTTFRHRIKPIVRYLLLPVGWGEGSTPVLDERDLVKAAHQVSIGLESDLFRKVGRAASQKLLTLSLLQHFNLGGLSGATPAAVGELVSSFTFQFLRWASLFYNGSLDYQEKRFRFINAGLSLLDARVDATRQAVPNLTLSYVRIVGGGSAATNTGLFELSPGGAIAASTSGELHTLSLDVQETIYGGIYASAGFDSTLALRPFNFIAQGTTPQTYIQAPEISFVPQYRFALGYVSPCQCFGVKVAGTMLHASNRNAYNSPALQAYFTVGDYTVQATH